MRYFKTFPKTDFYYKKFLIAFDAHMQTDPNFTTSNEKWGKFLHQYYTNGLLPYNESDPEMAEKCTS